MSAELRIFHFIDSGWFWKFPFFCCGRTHSISSLTISFAFCAQLWSSTIVSDPVLYSHPPWFHLNKVFWFPVATYVDHDGVFPVLLPSEHINYFERQHRSAYIHQDIVRVRRRWVRGNWGAWFNHRGGIWLRLFP